ncbi:MAG: sugar ABC transporter substrate-binding protein [Acidiphilium sp.]
MDVGGGSLVSAETGASQRIFYALKMFPRKEGIMSRMYLRDSATRQNSTVVRPEPNLTRASDTGKLANRTKTMTMKRKSGSLMRNMGLAMVVAAVGVAVSAVPAKASAAEPVTLVTVFRTLNNPYHVLWADGGKAFAKSIGDSDHFKVLATGPSNEAQLTAVQSLLASTPGKVALVVDPATNSITQALVQAVQKDPNAYIVVFWNKPPEFWPWNGYSHWISFISFDGVTAGEKTANVLFKAIGDKGNIIALQGILDNVPAKQRFAGLKAALKKNPGIHLLAEEPADWNQTKAFKVTQTLLSQYGNKITGIWAANDAMALGALQAVKEANLAGKVPIVSANDAIPQVLQDIKDGAGILATTDTDGYWDASAGLAMGYYAATGKLHVADLSHTQRAFYAKEILITKSNVGKYLAKPDAKQYSEDWTVGNLFDRVVKPIH